MTVASESMSATDMDPDEAREAAQEALDRMNLSKEETNRLGEAFKDPKFMQMFKEYVEEIKDPAHREETEQYLRKVEARGQAAELYGHGVQLITPCAGFVIKTKIVEVGAGASATATKIEEEKMQDDSSSLELGMKVFVNLCHSDRVSKATSTKVNGGCNWSIPYSLGAVRRGKDKAGAACDEHDFVVSTDTFDQCRTDMRFKGLVIDTALEAVESSTGRGVKLSREFSFPKMKYKGDTKQPSVQAWRDKASAAATSDAASGSSSVVDGRIRPAAHNKATKRPVDKDTQTRKNSASTFNFDFGAADAKTTFAKQCQLERVVDGGACYEPAYDIVYRYTRSDLGDAWQQGDANKQLDDGEERRHPDVLVMKIGLPRLESIAKVALDVTKSSVSLTCEDVYRLNAPFPLPVDEARGKAQFDKQKRQLTITLPVAPDQKKKLVKPFVEPRTTGAENDENASCDYGTSSFDAVTPPHTKKLVEEVPRPAGRDAPGGDAPVGVVEKEESLAPLSDSHNRSPDSDKKDREKQESEVERRWREMHERTDAERIGSSCSAQIAKTIEESSETEKSKAALDGECRVPSSSSSPRASVDGKVSTSETPDVAACSANNDDFVQEKDDTMTDNSAGAYSQRATVLPAMSTQQAAAPKPRLAPRYKTSSAIELE